MDSLYCKGLLGMRMNTVFLLIVSVGLVICSVPQAVHGDTASLSDPAQRVCGRDSEESVPTKSRDLEGIHNFFQKGVCEGDLETATVLAGLVPPSNRFPAVLGSLQCHSYKVFKYLCQLWPDELWPDEIGKQKVLLLISSALNADRYVVIYEALGKRYALDQLPILKITYIEYGFQNGPINSAIITSMARAGYKPKNGEVSALAAHFISRGYEGNKALNALIVEYAEEFTLNELLRYTIALNYCGSPALGKLKSILNGLTMTFKLKLYILSFIGSLQTLNFAASSILGEIGKMGHDSMTHHFEGISSLAALKFLAEKLYHLNFEFATSDSGTRTIFNAMDLFILANEIECPIVLRFINLNELDPFIVDPTSRKNLVQLLEGSAFIDVRQIVLDKMAQALKNTFTFAFYLMMPEVEAGAFKHIIQHVIKFSCLLELERNMPIFKSIE